MQHRDSPLRLTMMMPHLHERQSACDVHAVGIWRGLALETLRIRGRCSPITPLPVHANSTRLSRTLLALCAVPILVPTAPGFFSSFSSSSCCYKQQQQAEMHAVHFGMHTSCLDPPMQINTSIEHGSILGTRLDRGDLI